ncbi:MAG: hypothetical protein K6E62_03920 [Lachnospiraceae bacterium]|nr:hypothetical protein [Lachnospiraceae bacterium]
MRLFPLTFDEFLINTGREWYHDVIAGHYERMRPVPELVHNEINDILSDYLIIGGLPEIVQKYIDNKYSLENLEVEEYQLREFRNIRSAAEEYCNMDKTKTEALLNGSVAQQLDDSRHFAFQRLVKGSSYSYYKQEISALCDAGILLRSFFADHFRFFWPDTGLLNMKINGYFSAEQTIRDEVIVKNYIAQQLASGGIRLEYWCSKNSARIDHVTSYNGRKIALKYVGSSKKRIRPLQIFDKENNADEMIAITDSNFYIMGKLKFIPLYAVFCLFS